MFIEEPVLCEHMEEFKEIARAYNIPIATGEGFFKIRFQAPSAGWRCGHNTA